MKKIILFIIVVLFSGCASKGVIHSGQYTLLKHEDMPPVHVEPSDVSLINIDVKNHKVELFKADKKLLCNAEALPKKKWIEGCFTNTSHKSLETWELKHKDFKIPLYLVASCGKDLVLLSNSLKKDSLYNSKAFSKGGLVIKKIPWVVTTATISESVKLPDGSFAYTLLYNVDKSNARNRDNKPIIGPLDQHIFGLTKKAKKGQKLKLKYNQDEPMQFKLLEDIIFE
jgi:hypothetical protein